MFRLYMLYTDCNTETGFKRFDLQSATCKKKNLSF